MIDSENNGLSSSAVKPKHIVTPIILKDPTVSFSELKEVVYYPGNEKDSLDDAEAKARCTTLKRVSFGSSPETNVETFVYERIADDYSVESRKKPYVSQIVLQKKNCGFVNSVWSIATFLILCSVIQKPAMEKYSGGSKCPKSDHLPNG
uniref:Uncharacterized protein n=1 Tax=Romanomermis culicivorax TaxID=13658 RepID=A0A915KYE2_ROMCU